MLLPTLKSEDCLFQEGKENAVISSTSARPTSGTPACSPHTIFMPTLAGRQLCGLGLVSVFTLLSLHFLIWKVEMSIPALQDG